MTYWETIFFWVTLVLYALVTGGYLYALVFRNPRFMSKTTLVLALGLVVHTLAIAARFAGTGHLPWSGDYENALMGGWFILGVTLAAGWRNRSLQGFAGATTPLVLILMGYGYMQNPALTPMAASLKTFWLYIHVYFAWLAFGAYALAMAAGVILLLKRRSMKKGESNPTLDRFPDPDLLDEMMFRYVVFGFITDTIMIAAGAIWAKDLWGSYWSWDPVETWSLVSWLIYGISIHLRLTFGWRGERLAWLVVGALSTVIITFFGINLVVSSSLHVFQVR